MTGFRMTPAELDTLMDSGITRDRWSVQHLIEETRQRDAIGSTVDDLADALHAVREVAVAMSRDLPPQARPRGVSHDYRSGYLAARQEIGRHLAEVADRAIRKVLL